MATRRPLVVLGDNHIGELPSGDTLPLGPTGDLVAGTNITLTGTLTDRLIGSGNITIAASGGGGASGNVPIDVQNGTYTFVAGDVGRCKAKNNTTAYTYTLNNSVFAAGDWISVANFASTANITIARGSGVTLYYAGSTDNANRIVGPRGIATIYMESASVGYIYGAGVG